MQGDVIAIVDKDAKTVAEYSYDAWCAVTSAVTDTELTNDVDIATITPFRYRSYYLDTETGFYFLKTRYYDLEIGRFMTIDNLSYLDPDSINGLNLYAYCGNNPVIGYDPNGTFALLTTFLICLAIGAVIGGILGGYTAYSNGQDILTGIFTGALLGAAVGAVIGIGGTAVFIWSIFLTGRQGGN